MRAKGPRLFLLLDRAAHAVRQRLERRARDELDASMVQVGALFHIASHDGCLAKELAEALGIQPAGVSGLVDRMESGGLVQRKACAEDGRAQRLHVTSAGKRAVARAIPMVGKMQSVLTDGFTDDEIAVVVRFLEAANDREL
jgi:DNA-binding MarR family transcriptional regulator